MKPRSLTGPVLLVIVGTVFLINNIWQDIPLWTLVWDYWPFLLILLGVIGLIEALYHAGRGVPNPPRPLSGAGIFWIVMLVAFFSWAHTHGHLQFGPFGNGGISVLGTDYSYDVNVTGESRGVTRVVVDGLRGNLSVKGEDAGDVTVSGHKTVRAFNKNDADRANEHSTVRVDRQGDLLIVRADEPGSTRGVSVSDDLDITVPRGVDVETRGRNGDLTIDDISGSVTVSTGRGDVRVSNIGKDVKIESTRGNLVRATSVKGAVDLEGRGGDVQMETIGGQVTVNGEYSGTLDFHALAKPLHFQSEKSDFHVEAVPGTITLDLGDLKMNNVTGPVRFRTKTRDIVATDITSTLEIELEHGDIEVTQTKTVPRMDIHTHNGDLTLAVPEGSSFTLNARTAQGEATNDYGEPLKSEESGRAAAVSGGRGNGPELKLSTDRGSLTVKKS